MVSVSVAIEGLSDTGAANRLFSSVGLSVGGLYGRNGKPHLLQQLHGYNEAARHSPWFVMLDLDNAHDCPGLAREEWLPAPSEFMLFRIAVRELEAWLLGDVHAIARFLGVSQDLVPTNPEELPDPKRTLIDLARRSRKRDIRLGLVPREGSGASVGPTYASDIGTFAAEHWRPGVARSNAPYLGRCLDRLQEFSERLGGA